MPALLPTRAIGTGSKTRGRSAKTLARSKLEKEREVESTDASGGTLFGVATMNVKGKGMGLLSSQLRACGAIANGAKGAESDVGRSSKLFGNGVDLENRFGNAYLSSGSEHELNSVCLGAMVDGFIEDDSDNSRCGRSRCNHKLNGTACDCDDFEDSRSSLGGELAEILQGLIACISATERLVLSEVNKAIAVANCVVSLESGISNCLRRKVMKHLRTRGYNAAICKSRWDHVGSFSGGEYEYIDVVFEGASRKSDRIIIDIDFRGQFEIARPSTSYKAVVQVLPTVFVGKADQLFQIVNILSDAVKLSLKKSGMELPPWRKPEYMRAKWFATYKRTTNDTVFKTPDRNVFSISRIANRDSTTDEKEVDYLRVGERRVMKDLMNLVPKKPKEVSNMPSGAAVIAINNNDWTPPALKPRVFQRRGQAGLASILREAGLTSSIRTLIEEQRTESWKSLPIVV